MSEAGCASTSSCATRTAACAELFPEWIQLDDWGYPIVNPDAVPPELLKHARRAVQACPKVALLLEESGRS